jgi:hypothetical protein
MFMLVAFVLGLATVVIARGDLRKLGDLTFRGVALVFGALLVQVLIITIIPDGNEGVRAAVHIGTYLVIFLFLAANLRVPGVWLIAIGALLNFAAIAANGGVMPADPGATRRAGLTSQQGSFENSREVEGARLTRLGDRYAIPESWPASNVFSVGDVLIVLGAVVGMHQICRSRIVPERFLPVVRNAGPPSP